jgi:hypothetical protein
MISYFFLLVNETYTQAVKRLVFYLKNAKILSNIYINYAIFLSNET